MVVTPLITSSMKRHDVLPMLSHSVSCTHRWGHVSSAGRQARTSHTPGGLWDPTGQVFAPTCSEEAALLAMSSPMMLTNLARIFSWWSEYSCMHHNQRAPPQPPCRQQPS